MNVKTILSNLISNAFKYQRDDEVDKYVKVSVNVSGGTATMKVTDNGVGIKKDKVDEVFNMFYRAKRDNSGTGLGLFIVKEAVEKLNGKIDLESDFGVGTEITLTVPNKK